MDEVIARKIMHLSDDFQELIIDLSGICVYFEREHLQVREINDNLLKIIVRHSKYFS